MGKCSQISFSGVHVYSGWIILCEMVVLKWRFQQYWRIHVHCICIVYVICIYEQFSADVHFSWYTLYLQIESEAVTPKWGSNVRGIRERETHKTRTVLIILNCLHDLFMNFPCRMHVGEWICTNLQKWQRITKINLPGPSISLTTVQTPIGLNINNGVCIKYIPPVRPGFQKTAYGWLLLSVILLVTYSD